MRKYKHKRYNVVKLGKEIRLLVATILAFGNMGMAVNYFVWYTLEPSAVNAKTEEIKTESKVSTLDQTALESQIYALKAYDLSLYQGATPEIVNEILEVAEKRGFKDIDRLLKIVACESSFDNYAINHNRDGSLDLGLYQINE